MQRLYSGFKIGKQGRSKAHVFIIYKVCVETCQEKYLHAFSQWNLYTAVRDKAFTSLTV
jgi:hypothetical protein